jgi:ferredoxin-NADP reductase
MSAQPNWPIYSLNLKSRSEVAEGTLEFRFQKPPGMTFKAGQFMDLTLVGPPETDAEGNTRGFSINSAPDDPELIFTTRLRDTAFKRVLRTLPVGTAVKVEGPFGNLTLHNDPRRPAVLLAGGIGVTPFRSIVRRAAHEKLPQRIFLFLRQQAAGGRALPGRTPWPRARESELQVHPSDDRDERLTPAVEGGDRLHRSRNDRETSDG